LIEERELARNLASVGVPPNRSSDVSVFQTKHFHDYDDNDLYESESEDEGSSSSEEDSSYSEDY
jgi:hypothetical protein